MNRLPGRKHARVNFNSRVEIISADQSSTVFTIKNISLAGLFLQCKKQYFPGEQCTIKLTEKWARTSYTFAISGKVVRTSETGAAIQFTAMKAETYMMLQTFLLYRCRDPLALGAEFAGTCPVMLDEFCEKRVSTHCIN